MTGEAIAAESIDHVREASLAYLRAVLGDVELEELPVTRRRVDAPLSRFTVASPGISWMTEPGGYTAPVGEFEAATIAARSPRRLST
jgi:hypothetical protein